MKYLAVLALAIGMVQETRLSQEEARRYARLCVDQLMLEGAQIKIDADADKACAEKGEGGGAMVIPDKRLNEKTLLPSGKDVTPLGQLWLRKWTTVLDGKAVPGDRLRIVKIRVDDKDRPMPLFLLGVRKAGQEPELVLYASGNEPLHTVPLKKIELVPQLPLEIEWRRGEKDIDTLTLKVLGKYQAVLNVTRQ